MKKIYKERINTTTLENLRRAEEFKMWLENNLIKFSTKPNFDGFMFWCTFEIKATEAEADEIRAALDKIVYFDAITEIA